MGSRRILGFALGEQQTRAGLRALAMAVAVRDGPLTRRVHRGRVPAACERLSTRQSMGRPGSALDNAVTSPGTPPGVRAAAHRALRDPGSRPGRGRGLDRGLQPPPQAFRARPGQPGGLRAIPGGKGRRVTAPGRCAGRGEEGGGYAAAHLRRTAQATGPLLRPQGCWRIALRATALRAAPDPGDLGGPWRQEERSAQQPAPPGARRATPAAARQAPGRQGTQVNCVR